MVTGTAVAFGIQEGLINELLEINLITYPRVNVELKNPGFNQ